MKKLIKITLIIIITLSVITGAAYGGLKLYRYIVALQKERAQYEYIAMLLQHIDDNPESFYVSQNTKQNIDFTGLTTEKEKIVQILQVCDYNYLNSQYIGKYRKGGTYMTATLDPLEEVNPEEDIYMRSHIKTQMYELFNYDTTFYNKDGLLSPWSYDQNVFYMQDFTNEGAKESATLSNLLNVAIDAMNKGNYYLIYDKVYWEVLQYPRYIEETDSFELTKKDLFITEFETMENGRINHALDPQIAFFPFEVTSDVISDEGLSIAYNEEAGIYTINFSVNIANTDADYAAAYMYNLLTFEGGKLLDYSATVEVWDSGLIKSINENYGWDVRYGYGSLGIYMHMPFESVAYLSYHPDDADVSTKVSIFE